MANEFGATFLPGDGNDPMRRRPQMQGDALRVLAMTLPAALGPGAIAPDMLLGAQGAAGLPGQQASPLASLMAEAIVDQVLGQGGNMGPLAGMSQQIAPQAPVMPPGAGAPTALTGQASLSNTVRTEAARPTAQVASGAAIPAPMVSGAAQPGPRPGGAQGPPRVVPGTETPTPQTPIVREPAPPGTRNPIGLPEVDKPTPQPELPVDVGAALQALRAFMQPFNKFGPY